MDRQVLFLHGAPGDARVWTPVLDALPQGVDARAITLSYFGNAGWPGDGSDFGTERHCNDVLEYVRSTMQPPVSLVAWSYSCHPALLAALREVSLFSSLLLYEPGLATYIEDESELNRFEQDAGEAFGPVSSGLERAGPRSAVAALIDGSGGAGCFARLPPVRKDVYLAGAGIIPLLMGGGQPPANITAKHLAGLELPVTVICGERSRLLFAVASNAVATALPLGRLVTVNGADHMMPEVQPERFAGLVADWLGALEGAC